MRSRLTTKDFYKMCMCQEEVTDEFVKNFKKDYDNLNPEVLVSNDFATKYAQLCAWVEQASKIKDMIDSGIKEIEEDLSAF